MLRNGVPVRLWMETLERDHGKLTLASRRGWRTWEPKMLKLLPRWLSALSFTLALLAPSRLCAATEIQWWHAMSGELGRQVERLASDFNASQDEYRILPVYKGSYAETVTAAIFAFRSRNQPAIVQVNEIATATMMAAKGAIYPVHQMMQDQSEPFSQGDFLPAILGYYADTDGRLLSFPFNVSTPILYYNKQLFRAAGLDADVPPRTWPELEVAARRLRAAGAQCGFTTGWPSWIHVENFLAFHDLPLATMSNGLDGLGAELLINDEAMVRHIGQLVEWQKFRLFDYSGRATAAEPRFQNGECGIFIGSSATRADIIANARFDIGYGMLPYWPHIKSAPQNSMIGGATLWVLRDRPASEYGGVAKFLGYLSRPEVQATWHQSTGYLAVTRAAVDLSHAQGFYERNAGLALAIEQLSRNIPTQNSKGLRLGSFVLVRDTIENELELAFSGKKEPKAALDAAVERGNRLLRQFERANR